MFMMVVSLARRDIRMESVVWHSIPACSLFLLTIIFFKAVSVQRAEEDLTPRLSFIYDTEDRLAKRFSPVGVFNFTTMLLSPGDNTLYIGAREVLFALNLSDISRLQLHRNITWSTPKRKREECSFKGKNLHNTKEFSLVRSSTGDIVTEDGRNHCPYNPEYKSTAIMAGGDLYAATISNFQGNEPIIYKSFGRGTTLKTENSLNWLEDPAFVGSAFIQESLPKGNAVGDDDKIYFFFSEAGKEFNFFDNTIVSRIARVCKDDKGGERVLQKKWTTFLKAQLLCSLPGDGFPFNIIQDIFVLTPSKEDWKSTVFYGVFTSQWYKTAIGSSAVCTFTMSQVEEVFNGRYREVNRETQQWYTYNNPIPEPRPGSCITNAARAHGMFSSLHMPDKVLNFVKDHFLMDNVIRGQPLLIQKNVHYIQITVHRVQAVHSAYNVLFLGTDDGRLHKAINSKGKMHIIEELKLFLEPQPVQNIILDAEKGVLYVSSYSILVEIPVANCSNHKSCEECILTRDPYCGWTRGQCLDVRHASSKSKILQDIEDANIAICDEALPKSYSALSSIRILPCQVIRIPANTFQVLPCKLRSNLAERRWEYSKGAGRFLYPSSDGGLVVVAQTDRDEFYECWSVEKGFWQPLANYCVKAEPQHESTTPTGSSNTPLMPKEEPVILPGDARSSLVENKSYWNELIVVCTLLGFSLLVFSLCLIYRNRDRMKTMLKQSECPNMQQKKAQMAGKPTESLPLNGNNVPSSVADHKGYQTLHDNYFCNTPTQECSSPENSKSFSESEQHLKDTCVEISPTCPRPRVRLGSQIKDSVI
ncbi:sema domain, immunoglobulin domain (Ig), transmembrane domain (TM) and short cytoplasmic domain, (semaphorin) 4Ba isoform X2 [Tachysurus fulvidraco]|uniref:sema domain, immunoglobulin domain (Ig), transmembrane domain (TM) and short cytoplasmic domain, (semaphorin) 4Ba isoform X2 n=1 Tax=Tachysurus fulvidraco TaxID=1234273 RepID=UPI000F4D7DD8|nr:sema domain, immunoglobulin domain (Ig), transmembrane domain (TM) and short cytoplasmic domain, (semaphorin) 4Ba isoform X2 [Tachysurus fulvidraco]